MRELTRFPPFEVDLSHGLVLAVYAALTALVWGIFAFDRGMWQDDASILAVLHDVKSYGVAGFFRPVGPATRRLLGLPYIAAIWSASPVVVLQTIYGLTWLGNGWLARSICIELLPGRTTTAFLAGALTICATSDFLANSLVSLGYDLSVLAFLLSIVCALRWLGGRGWPWLAAAALALAASYSTTEGALTSMILAPGVFLVATSGRFTRRLMVLLTAWAASLAPFLWQFLAFLRDPNSYAAVALAPMPLTRQLRMAFALVANNFLPWQWLLHRPIWGAQPVSVIPSWIYVLASVTGTVLVLRAVLARKEKGSPPENEELATSGTRAWVVAGLALGLTIAANAAFTRVQFASIFYRTHVMSRIWASLAVAAASGGAAAMLGRRARLALVPPGVFVLFGIAGGIERQDFYLSSWWDHKKELRSVVEQVPGLREGARMILYAPPYAPFQALEVPYLGRAWINLLYDDPKMGGRAFLWMPGASYSCTPEREGFRCCDYYQEGCGTPGGPTGTLLPYSETVLLAFSTEDARYHLQERLPASVVVEHPDWELAYAPDRLITRAAISPLGARLLYAPDGLARFLK